MNRKLEEIAHIYNGVGYSNNPVGDKIPIYGTGGLMGYTSIHLYEGPAVLSGRKGSINNPIYVEGKFWNVDTIFCIKTHEGVDTKWLFYNFQNTDLTKLNEATGVPSVTSKALYKLRFKWCDYPEQRRIAHILSTTDTVIEKTQAAIAKYKAIKQGMLHDLFTRGIDTTSTSSATANKLRPSYQEAPELYKESKLGWIPREWEVERLETICEINPLVNLPPSLKVNDEVSFIKMEDVTNNAEIINFHTKKIFEVIKKGFTPFMENDVLFAKITPCMENGKGALALGLKNKFGFGSTEFHVLRAFNSKSIHFIFHLTTSTSFRLKAAGKMSGSAGQQRVPASFLKDFQIAIPSFDEQYTIGLRINSIDKKLQSEQTYLHKLQQIKRGLMEDLLSGRKRLNL